MRTWIDNTGLQSAGQCLNGRADASTDYDVRGLLQLATLMVFSDRITLNGFEDAEIAARSQATVEQITEITHSPELLSVYQINEAEYALACRTAAESVAQYLAETFSPNDSRLLQGGPPELRRGLRQRQVDAIALAYECDGSEKLALVNETALDSRAIGAVEFMLASSAALREAVKSTIQSHPDWGPRTAYQLNIFLRYHLNSALGEQAFSMYAPAIARAELIQQENQFWLDALHTVTGSVIEELRGEPLGIPSTLAALLQRSGGSPGGVLKVATELRQHSGALRSALGKLSQNHDDSTPEGRFEIHRELAELGQQLRRDVKLEKSTRFRDAIEFRMVLGMVPTLSLSLKELSKWADERKKRKQTAVLTELIKTAAFAETASDPYAKLRTAASRMAS